MLKIANAPENERKVLFLNTAEKLRMHPVPKYECNTFSLPI